MRNLGKLYLCRKNHKKSIRQAVINLHPCVSVSNCNNDKNKTKELLERDACRTEGGHHKEVTPIFCGLGFVKQEHTFVRLCGEAF